ncbi:metallophosphoesterase family protein [Roseovarius sp. 2305UL8-3]|uniref:metallophosphoesterase family protein n=1 Tax=Roseovarius conchicola TaxID=3121636 RepID=UPI0035284296
MPNPIYVIPDIHGHKDKLDHALSLIAADGGGPVVFLGDYVDRGPDSCGVLQVLVDGLAAGQDWTLLRGNHDQLMLNALTHLRNHPDAPREDIRWLSYKSGAREALLSYGVSPGDPAKDILSAIPSTHLTLLADTRLSHQTPDLIFAHAGIRPGIALVDQTPEDLMWMREPFLSDTSDHGRLVVHGHSPVMFPEHHGNRIALDGGAGWDRDLHVAVFEGRSCWLLDEGGRQPLVPG